MLNSSVEWQKIIAELITDHEVNYTPQGESAKNLAGYSTSRKCVRRLMRFMHLMLIYHHSKTTESHPDQNLESSIVYGHHIYSYMQKIFIFRGYHGLI